MKASITFYPNALKKSKRTSKVPLYARVYCNALKAEERLNAEVTENDLAKWDPMSMRFSDRNLMANKLLNILDKRLFEEFVILQATSLPSTAPRKILDYCLGKEEKKVPVLLLDYVDRYLQSAVLHNPDLTPGTVRNYKKAINHFKTFLLKKGKRTLQLKELNHTLALEFKDYIQSNKPDEEKKGMSEDSASSYSTQRWSVTKYYPFRINRLPVTV